MKSFVIDSNIVWSTAYNPKSEIGQVILLSEPAAITFFAPEYLKVEVERHIPKIVQLSGLTEEQIRETIGLAYTRISFIADAQIPYEFYARTAPLVRDVDPDDLPFVALADYLGLRLWSGDTALRKGLRAKGYTNVFSFQEIKAELIRK